MEIPQVPKVTGANGRRWPEAALSPEDRSRRAEYVLLRRASGASLRQIAAELGCARGTVHEIVKAQRDLRRGYYPERYLRMTHRDSRGITWQFTDDAWVASSPNYMNMISSSGEELKFGEVVERYGFRDDHVDHPYIISTYARENR